MFSFDRFLKIRYPVLLLIGVLVLGGSWVYTELRPQLMGDTIGVQVGDCTETVRKSRKGRTSTTIDCTATWTDSSGTQHTGDLQHAAMADENQTVRAHVLDGTAVKEGTVEAGLMVPLTLGGLAVGILWLVIAIRFRPGARTRRQHQQPAQNSFPQNAYPQNSYPQNSYPQPQGQHPGQYPSQQHPTGRY